MQVENHLCSDRSTPLATPPTDPCTNNTENTASSSVSQTITRSIRKAFSGLFNTASAQIDTQPLSSLKDRALELTAPPTEAEPITDSLEIDTCNFQLSELATETYEPHQGLFKRCMESVRNAVHQATAVLKKHKTELIAAGIWCAIGCVAVKYLSQLTEKNSAESRQQVRETLRKLFKTISKQADSSHSSEANLNDLIVGVPEFVSSKVDQTTSLLSGICESTVAKLGYSKGELLGLGCLGLAASLAYKPLFKAFSNHPLTKMCLNKLGNTLSAPFIHQLWLPNQNELHSYSAPRSAFRYVFPNYTLPSDYPLVVNDLDQLTNVQPELGEWLMTGIDENFLKFYREELWGDPQKWITVKRYIILSKSNRSELLSQQIILDKSDPYYISDIFHKSDWALKFLLEGEVGKRWALTHKKAIWSLEKNNDRPMRALREALLYNHPLETNESLYPIFTKVDTLQNESTSLHLNYVEIFCLQSFAKHHPTTVIRKFGTDISNFQKIGITLSDLRITYFLEGVIDVGGPKRSFISDLFGSLGKQQPSMIHQKCPSIEPSRQLDSAWFNHLGHTMGFCHRARLPIGDFFSPEVYRAFSLIKSETQLNPKTYSDIKTFKTLLGGEDGDNTIPYFFTILDLLSSARSSNTINSETVEEYDKLQKQVQGYLDYCIKEEFLPSFPFKVEPKNYLNVGNLNTLESYYTDVLTKALGVENKFTAISAVYSGLKDIITIPDDSDLFMKQLQGSCSADEIIELLNPIQLSGNPRITQIKNWLEKNSQNQLALNTFLYNITGSVSIPYISNINKKQITITLLTPLQYDKDGHVLSIPILHACSRWIEIPWANSLTETQKSECEAGLQCFLNDCQLGKKWTANTA